MPTQGAHPHRVTRPTPKVVKHAPLAKHVTTGVQASGVAHVNAMGTATPRSSVSQIRDIDATSRLNRAKGIGTLTVPKSLKVPITRILVKRADTERAKLKAAQTPHKTVAHAKTLKATKKPAVHHPAGKKVTPSSSSSSSITKKPQTSPITPPDGGGSVGPLNSGGDTKGGWGDLIGGLAHYAIIAGVVIALIYAWRKGYIQKVAKSASRIGKKGRK